MSEVRAMSTLAEVDERAGRMERAERLIIEARRLRAAVRDVARATVATDERHIKAMALVNRCDDRISRREYRFRCAADETVFVSTATIARWIRDRIDVYEHFGEVDAAEIAGDACNVFGLWDDHGSIPAWVWGLCERVAPRAVAELQRKRAFFVEKRLNYTEDGDVLFA